MRYWKAIYSLLLAITLVAPAADAQFFSTCEECTESELAKSMESHNIHIYRLNYKFNDIWYFQGRIPEEAKKLLAVHPEEVLQYLRNLKPRRAAALFYAQQENRFCTWLMSPHTQKHIIGHKALIDNQNLSSLQQRLIDAIGVSRLPKNRAPSLRGFVPEAKSELYADSGQALKEASALLLPETVSQALLAAEIDTLVIVPIGVKYIDEHDENKVFVTSIGTVPFAALSIGDRALVEQMSIVVAPGFFVVKDEPPIARSDFSQPIIVGDPQGWNDPRWKFPELPGARTEAQKIGDFFGSQALVLIGSNAGKAKVEEEIKNRYRTGLIHLATHGIADQANPLDESFLLLSDNRWLARDISRLNLASRPLVVMSACQTGLGKDFVVGTIGLARAWLWAGASSVVMSLWNVDDCVTRDLMTSFIPLAENKPVDKALQEAMLHTREKQPNPAYWAGFTVFGKPQP